MQQEAALSFLPHHFDACLVYVQSKSPFWSALCVSVFLLCYGLLFRRTELDSAEVVDVLVFWSAIAIHAGQCIGSNQVGVNV